MKIKLEFSCEGAAFEEDLLGEIQAVLEQANHKVVRQLGRAPGCVCTAPEAADKLLDVYGNTVGWLKVEK